MLPIPGAVDLTYIDTVQNDFGSAMSKRTRRRTVPGLLASGVSTDTSSLVATIGAGEMSSHITEHVTFQRKTPAIPQPSELSSDTSQAPSYHTTLAMGTGTKQREASQRRAQLRSDDMAFRTSNGSGFAVVRRLCQEVEDLRRVVQNISTRERSEPPPEYCTAYDGSGL